MLGLGLNRSAMIRIPPEDGQTIFHVDPKNGSDSNNGETLATAWASLDPFETWHDANPGTPSTVYVYWSIVQRTTPLVITNDRTRIIGFDGAQILGSVQLTGGTATSDTRINSSIRSNVTEWDRTGEAALSYNMGDETTYSSAGSGEIYSFRWSGVSLANNALKGGIARVCHKGRTLRPASWPTKANNELPNDLIIAKKVNQWGWLEKRTESIAADIYLDNGWRFTSDDSLMTDAEKATVPNLDLTGSRTPVGTYSAGEVFFDMTQLYYYTINQATVTEIVDSTELKTTTDLIVYGDPVVRHRMGSEGGWHKASDEQFFRLTSIYEFAEADTCWTDLQNDKVFAWLSSAADETTRLQVNTEAVIQIEASDVLLQGLEIGEGMGDGVQVRTGTNITIKDCITRSCGRHNICVFPDLDAYEPVRNVRLIGGKSFDSGIQPVALLNGYCPRVQPNNNPFSDTEDSFNGGEFGSGKTDYDGDESSGNLVERVEFDGSGYLAPRMDQLLIWGRGNTIRRCHFHDAPGSAIGVQYGDYTFIEDNLFDNLCSLAGDWGAIRLGGWPIKGYGNAWIRRNYFKGVAKKLDVYASVNTIYSDFLTNDVHFEDNVFEDCDVVARCYGMNHSFTGNTMIDCGFGPAFHCRWDNDDWTVRDPNGNPTTVLTVTGNTWVGDAPGLSNGQPVFGPSDPELDTLFDTVGIMVNDYHKTQPATDGSRSRLTLSGNSTAASADTGDVSAAWG